MGLLQESRIRFDASCGTQVEASRFGRIQLCVADDNAMTTSSLDVHDWANGES